LLIVKYPLRAITFSRKAAHLTTCCIWVYSSIFPIAAILRDKGGVYFSYLYYNCSYSCTINKIWTPVGKALYNVAVGISVFSGTAVTIVSSVLLLILARKVSKRAMGKLQWQGVSMVLATVAFHILFSIPVVVAFVASFFVNESEHSTTYPDYLNRMFRCAVFIAAVAPMGNFFIYTMTLSSFREFLQAALKKMTATWKKQDDEDTQGSGELSEERKRLKTTELT
jgi:hypothetical protein